MFSESLSRFIQNSITKSSMDSLRISSRDCFRIFLRDAFKKSFRFFLTLLSGTPPEEAFLQKSLEGFFKYFFGEIFKKIFQKFNEKKYFGNPFGNFSSFPPVILQLFHQCFVQEFIPKLLLMFTLKAPVFFFLKNSSGFFLILPVFVFENPSEIPPVMLSKISPEILSFKCLLEFLQGSIWQALRSFHRDFSRIFSKNLLIDLVCTASKIPKYSISKSSSFSQNFLEGFI